AAAAAVATSVAVPGRIFWGWLSSGYVSPRIMLAILALAQKRSNGDVDQELNRIKEAAEYLNGIISDILSLPLNENETWELNDTLDLRSLLETLIANYTSEAGNKGVKLAFKGCVADALVPTHGNTLIGVFDNVLRNALHYTSPNTPIDIILGNEDDRHYRVQIVDRGAGVPEQNLNDIFQPFYRLDEARDRRSGGHGLGLAIAQRTVALHNGSISASNNPEGGLTVTIILRKADLD
ncbi:MAG: ATP-binding protein, partial [Exilibacterium sp.]